MGMYEVNRFVRMLKSEDRLYARLSCVSEIGAARRRGLSPSRKPRSGVLGVQPRRREGGRVPLADPWGAGTAPCDACRGQPHSPTPWKGAWRTGPSVLNWGDVSGRALEGQGLGWVAAGRQAVRTSCDHPGAGASEPLEPARPRDAAPGPAPCPAGRRVPGGPGGAGIASRDEGPERSADGSVRAPAPLRGARAA